MSKVERVGVSLDKELLAAFDELIRKQGYQSRSEAIRDMIRASLVREELADARTEAVAGVFLVYDHHAAHLSQKLIDLQHNHLLHVLVSTHIHLDFHNCLEIIILKGKVAEIDKLSSNIGALKGVKLSKTTLMTTAFQGKQGNMDENGL